MATILITGGSRGIGRALVEHYAGDGWDVIATARSDDDLAELDAMDRVEALGLDVTDEASVERFLSAIGDRAIDVFLNNAGVGRADPTDRDAFLKTLEINSVAPTILALALKDNVAASDQKKMAVITSKMGSMTDNGSGGSIPYRASKAAVNAAWRSLSIDLKDDGIAIAILHPGWVRTDMGGPQALIDVDTSASGLKQRIDELTLENSGTFQDYSGAAIGW